MEEAISIMQQLKESLFFLFFTAGRNRIFFISAFIGVQNSSNSENT